MPNVFTMVALLAKNEAIKTYRYHFFVLIIISEYRLRKCMFLYSIRILTDVLTKQTLGYFKNAIF